MIEGRRWSVEVTVLVTLVLASVRIDAAQSLAQFESWKEQPPRRTLKVACRDLRSLTNFEMSISAATIVQARGEVPEFCQVQGMIAPEVLFEVSLPMTWNGRLYMFGNGGTAGEPLDQPSRVQRRDAALKAGFAVAQTNTGHDQEREPLWTFALIPQKLIDHAYRAVHVTAMSAKSIVGAYYQQTPTKSYFAGCSTGGRQGLISAQRFPEDFDGILVGAPAGVTSTGSYWGPSNAHRAKMIEAFANGPLSEKKVKLIAEKVYGKCDASDGVADGIIADPRHCSFDLDRDVPACGPAADEDACLTSAEIKSLQAIYGGVVSGGVQISPGLPPGAEAFVPTASGSRSGWDIQGLLSPTSLLFRRAEGFFLHAVAPGTRLDWKTFDFVRDRDKLNPVEAVLNPSDQDLSRFRARGGKIIMYAGWADSTVNPVFVVDYYEAVRRTMGTTTDAFFRFFPMPGMFHCSNGPGPDLADMMTPLVEWVERGTIPTSITARREIDGKTVRTRPLCPYPQIAKYKGTGSIDIAQNFICSNP